MSKGSLKKLLFQFRLIEKALDYESLKDQEISKWSICEHLDHITIATELILEKLRTDLVESPLSLTLTGRLVLLFGIIPRNKGTSPRSVLPSNSNPKKIKKNLNKLKKECLLILNNWDELQLETKKMPHHVFGMMTGKQWIRFATIHINHHLNIARDIVATQSVSESNKSESQLVANKIPVIGS